PNRRTWRCSRSVARADNPGTDGGFRGGRHTTSGAVPRRAGGREGRSWERVSDRRVLGDVLVEPLGLDLDCDWNAGQQFRGTGCPGNPVVDDEPTVLVSGDENGRHSVDRIAVQRFLPGQLVRISSAPPRRG